MSPGAGGRKVPSGPGNGGIAVGASLGGNLYSALFRGSGDFSFVCRSSSLSVRSMKCRNGAVILCTGNSGQDTMYPCYKNRDRRIRDQCAEAVGSLSVLNGGIILVLRSHGFFYGGTSYPPGAFTRRPNGRIFHCHEHAHQLRLAIVHGNLVVSSQAVDGLLSCYNMSLDSSAVLHYLRRLYPPSGGRVRRIKISS